MKLRRPVIGLPNRDNEDGDFSASDFSENDDLEDGLADTPGKNDEESSIEAPKIAVKENKAVGRSRLIMIAVLAFAAVIAAGMAFLFTLRAENSDFENNSVHPNGIRNL